MSFGRAGASSGVSVAGTLTGAWSAANKHFLRALKLLQKLSDEQVDRLVTHRFSLEQANEALIAAERQETLKAVIVP